MNRFDDARTVSELIEQLAAMDPGNLDTHLVSAEAKERLAELGVAELG
jgi:hypothetical protein